MFKFIISFVLNISESHRVTFFGWKMFRWETTTSIRSKIVSANTETSQGRRDTWSPSRRLGPASAAGREPSRRLRREWPFGGIGTLEGKIKTDQEVEAKTNCL